MVQSEKMSAVGQLAGGIAHDLNNGLTPVIGYLDFLLTEPNIPDEAKAMLGEAKQSARRCTDVVEKLLSVSRSSSAKKTLIDPRKILTEYEGVLRKALPATVLVEIRCAEKISPLFGNESELLSTLLNLAVNSKDAMENSVGKLTLDVKNFYITESQRVDAPVGPYVLFSVTDTGKGISPQILQRIYEPFFTTKDKGKGPGLGLSMVFNTVKDHGGWIEVSSQEGKGTTFQIYLPASVKESGSARVDTQTPTEHIFYSKGETILFVDDEKTIRDLGSIFMKKLGYEFFLAQDGEEALKIYSEKKDQLALVILDMTMPRLTGMDLIRGILLINPSAKIIAASGYTSEGNASEILSAGARGFLTKPYTLAPFSKLIRKILDS